MLLTVNFNDQNALYSAYMPYIQNGAVFIATDVNYQLGDQVDVEIILPDETQAFHYTGSVVWVTPKHAQGGKTPGIGVQFNEQDAKILRPKIDKYLAGTEAKNDKTDTM